MVVTKYITRVTLEFVYEAGSEFAQTVHDSIIQTVVDGAGAIDEQVGMVVTNVETRIASAVRPMLASTDIDMPPGGSEVTPHIAPQSEGTKNAPDAPGGTEQTGAFIISGEPKDTLVDKEGLRKLPGYQDAVRRVKLYQPAWTEPMIDRFLMDIENNARFR